MASLEGEEQAQLEEVYCRSTRMRDDNAKRWPESKDPAEAEVYQQQARACADVRANARSVLERKYGLVGDLECCEEFKLCAPEAPTPQEGE